MAELTDAEWLRGLATFLHNCGATHDRFEASLETIARLRSIAAKLERPAVEGFWFNLNYNVTVILNESGAAFLSGKTGDHYKAGDRYTRQFHDIISTFGGVGFWTHGFRGPFKGNAMFFGAGELRLGTVDSPESPVTPRHKRQPDRVKHSGASE